MASVRTQRPSRELDNEKLLDRAVSLHERARPSEARKLHLRILRGDDPHAQRAFARVAQNHRMFELAARLLAKAIRLGLDEADMHNDLGVALLGCERPAEAEASFRTACALEPADAMVLRNLARALTDGGDLAAAASSLESAIGLAPTNPVGLLDLAELRLGEGHPDDALRLIERALAPEPHATRALALQSVALCELGEGQRLSELIDPVRFIACIGAEEFACAGQGDLANFNARLRNHISRHRALTREPRGLATRKGWNTVGNLLRDEAPLMRDLERLTRDAITRYVAALPVQPHHPFLQQRRVDFRLEAWGVKLQREGHQEPHIHRDGWLSGVYYVSLGEIVRDDDPAHEGWIEFGRAPERLMGIGRAPITHLVRPREGTFVIFPSYLWHRTLPFSQAGERFSFAFDVIPLR